jgi:predicted metal-dependent phosphoesterase TrpH
VIDLHLHTTASDGRLSPADLVTRVAAARITTMSVTDHDTVAALADVRRCATAAGIRVVDGIEITAVHDARDVHILGYFIDPGDEPLAVFLQSQRTRRVERVREMGARLAALGVPVDVSRILALAARKPGTSVGRPMLARALVERGHAVSIQDAFERFLAAGQPAYVPRTGPSPSEVVDVIHRAAGIASMAHPGVTRQPAVMARLVDDGLDAIEAYHSDHPLDVQRELLSFAARHGLLVTGGSDHHGDDERDRPLGRVTLPAAEFERLQNARG